MNLICLGCGRGDSPNPAAFAQLGPVPVLVATVIQKTVTNQLGAIGTVQAYSTVSVKAQVDGKLADVHFREGEDVKKGQLLFTIDPAPLQAVLEQTQANLARDQAQLEQATADERRYTIMLKRDVASRQQYDQAHAAAAALRATALADKAAVETARINLAYTTIRSPIDGRTGSLLIHPGNLVKANDASSVLVVINQVRPVYVNFYLPEKYLDDIRDRMAARELDVEALPNRQQGPPERGVLSFIDNAVDPTTGTFALKGLFTNAEQRLWPGEFVNVELTLSRRPDALLVPSQAVQTGQDGSYVYVVGPGMAVEPRPVVIGSSVDAATIIESGLRAGETVVTDGQLRLFPGAKVRIKGSVEADRGQAS